MLTWKKARALFDADVSEIVCENDPNRDIWTMTFLTAGASADSPLCLYVLFAHDIGKVELSDCISLVVVAPPDKIDSSQLSHVANCLRVDEGFDALTSCSRITETLSEQYSIGYLMYCVHDAIYRNRGLQSVVDEVADFFKLPVSVMDSSFRFLARSQRYSEQSDDESVRVGSEEEGLRVDVLDELAKSGSLEKVFTSKGPVHLSVRDNSAWFAPIFVNHARAAYLTVFEQGSRPEAMLDERNVYALSLIAEAASIEIAKDNFYLYNKASYFSYIFSLILERASVDLEDIRARLHIFGYDLRQKLYVLCLDLPHGAALGPTRMFLADTLKETFHNSIYVNRDRTLIFLISRGENDLVSDKELASWNRALASAGVSAGLAGPFEELTATANNLKLARQALDAGIRSKTSNIDEKNLFRFEERQIDALLTLINADDLYNYRYRPFMRVVTYDQEHHTDLVATLREYLRNPKDIAGICKALCIHKNTLYKRLDRIRSVMDSDFSSGEEIMAIQLTMHMLDLSQR